MLKTMKFDEKFPCSWPKQLFTIEKTKKSPRCTSQICSDMQNTGNSIKMVEIAYKQAISTTQALSLIFRSFDRNKQSFDTKYYSKSSLS